MNGSSWWRTRSGRFWMVVLAPLLVLGACGLFSLHARKTVADAEREADVFHRMLVRGQYGAIYDAAAESYRQGVTRANSARYFAGINGKMGACRAAEAPTHFTHTGRSGSHVQLRYTLQCANGALRETMLYLITPSGPRLAGYDANSPALAIR